MGEAHDWENLMEERIHEPSSQPCPTASTQSCPTAVFNIFNRRATVGGSVGCSSSTTTGVRDVSCAGDSTSFPVLAEMERVRSKKRKAPEGPRGRSVGGRKTKETTVSIAQRLKEFPDQSLKESAGKIFCVACKEEQPNLKESLKRHVDSSKHKSRLVRLEQSSAHLTDLSHDLVEYFKSNPGLKGSSLESKKHSYRFRVTQTFLLSGTPLHRLDFFKPILELAELSVGTSSDLAAEYIPLIEMREFKLLKSEVCGQYLGIAFDGTSRLGEAVNITGRFCTSNFKLEKRLLRFVTSKLHLKANEFAAIITRVLCTELGVDPRMLVALARDSVLVNGAACRILQQGVFNTAENQMCIAHTLNNVGGRINFAELAEFMTPWLELVGGRHPHRGAQALWRRAVHPTPVPGYSHVRWYANAEIQFVLAEHYNKLPSLLDELDRLKYGDATRAKLRSVFHSKGNTLQLQLAGMLDMRIIVRTTYQLEGDGLELLLVYDRIERLREVGKVLRDADGDGVLPNVDSILRASAKLQHGTKIRKHFDGHGICTGRIISSRQVDSTIYPGERRKAFNVRYDTDGNLQEFEDEEIRPLLIVTTLPERQTIVRGLLEAFEYLEARITGMCETSQYSCSHMYAVCKLSRAFDPSFAVRHLTATLVDELVSTIQPLSSHIEKEKLKQELPSYVSVAKDVVIDHDNPSTFTAQLLDFWQNSSKKEMETWRWAARIVFAISPNSASCERVFSLLDVMYGEDRQSVLADHLQSSLMMRYNGRCVASE